MEYFYTKTGCIYILDTAKTIYIEEGERFKQTEAKTNITLAFAGILFGAYLTYLGSAGIHQEVSGYYMYSLLFNIGIFASVIISIYYFLRSIKSAAYNQVDLTDIVNMDFAKQDERDVILQIAATYQEAINLNRDKIEDKIAFYSKGLRYLLISFFAFSIHVLIEEAIKYVQ